MMAKFNLYALLLALAFAVLAGCGTKGPLYIPEQRYPQQAPQKVEQPAPSNSQTQPSPTQNQ